MAGGNKKKDGEKPKDDGSPKFKLRRARVLRDSSEAIGGVFSTFADSTRVKPLRAVGNFISSTLGMAESFMQETKIVQDFNLTTTVSLVACLQKDLEDAKSFDAKLKIREKIDSL